MFELIYGCLNPGFLHFPDPSTYLLLAEQQQWNKETKKQIKKVLVLS